MNGEKDVLFLAGEAADLEETVADLIEEKDLIVETVDSVEDALGSIKSEEIDVVVASSKLSGLSAVVGEVKDEQAGGKYHMLIENVSDVVYFYHDDHLEFINQGASDLTGYTREDLYDIDIRRLIHPDDLKRVKESLKKQDMDENTSRFEARIVTRDDEVRECEFMIKALEYRGRKGVLRTVRDITERKKLEDRSRVLNSLLRHEVRNKVQLIKGFLDLAEMEPDEQKEFFEKIDRTAQQILSIINKVDKFQKLEDKQAESINIIPLVRQAAQKSIKQDEDIDVRFDIKCEHCEAMASSLLEEMFSNIIENAVVHSQCSEIVITVRREPEDISVSIEDDGRGIPDELQERIFKRGEKGKGSEGSGLGMFLVEKIADRYGAEVEVHDSDLGGARFDVHLEKA